MKSFKWINIYNLAKKYYEEHGNLLVPQNYIVEKETEDGTVEKIKLGVWIMGQRQRYNGINSSKLSNEQIKLLKEIGMVWNTISKSWEEKYELAKKYYKEHGDLLVPLNYEVEKETEEGRIEKVQLGYWIITQRQKYNGTINGELLDEQIELLEKIGMIWNIQMYKLVNKEITRKTKKKILLKLEKILLEKILIKDVNLDNNEKEKINKKMLLYLDRY